MLVIWDLRIRYQHFAKWKRHLGKYPLADSSQPDIEQAKKLNAHIECIVRHAPLELNCMRRCLALKTMLARRQMNTTLHIGVKFESQQELAAHAWISANKQLLNDTQQNVAQYREITKNHEKFIM